MRVKRHVQRWAMWTTAASFAATGLAMLGDGLWMQGKAALAQHLLEDAWANTQAGEARAKPWAWADMWPAFQLEVPRASISLIVLEGSSGEALAFAPGWMSSTPRPGETGLSVIAAHRDTHFAFLKHANIGDRLWVTDRHGSKTAFDIESTHIVNANSSGLNPYADGERLALVTCWPFDALEPGPLRFVAIATLADASAS